MASGVVSLADVAGSIAAPFSEFTQKLTEEKTKFLASGIVQPSPQIARFLAGPGMVLTMPTWKDLDNDAPKIANEADGVMLGGSALTPHKLTTYNEVAIRITRTQQWAANKLQDYLTGDDAFTAIANRVSDYEARMLQLHILAILEGVFADNDANDSGDMIHDVSGAGFVAGVTNFTAENLLDAIQTAGDSQEDFKVIAVHSRVYNRMRKGALLDFIRDDKNDTKVPYFGDLRVVVDDGMPVNGQVCTSYIFEPGALQMAWGSVERPTSTAFEEDAGNGIGQEILYRRWQHCVHPMGFAYTGATTNGGGPSDSTLEAAASWNRACPERKQVKMAALITREA